MHTRARACALCVAQVITEPTLLKVLMDRLRRFPNRTDALGSLANLSDRELEVAMLISSGMSDPEIAKALYRSTRTVHSHRAAIGKKINLQRRSDISQLMLRRGFVAYLNEPPTPQTPLGASGDAAEQDQASSKARGEADDEGPIA